MNLTKADFFDNITPKNIKAHSEVNIENVKKTIHDLSFDSKKILICGRGENIHPEFTPRFTTPSTMIKSDLYVTVDHHPPKKEYFTKKGKYALSLIVHPDVPKKILELGGEIFWFSPQYLENDLPKIISGLYTMDNSGLCAISLANYFNANSILLSGIKLINMYEKFLEGKDLVFQTVLKNNSKIFSLDGILAEQITFDDWKNC
jgi:hypothetical protein